VDRLVEVCRTPSREGESQVITVETETLRIETTRRSRTAIVIVVVIGYSEVV